MTDLFNEKAKDWDVDVMVKNLSSAIGISILENIPLHDQMSVMDFGAGTGLISAQVAPFVKKIVAENYGVRSLLDSSCCFLYIEWYG